MRIHSETFLGKEPEFVLKTVFGYDSFRSLQKDIIQSVLAKKDTLAIMPTGGGKSLCYQIPALILDGMTVVVSPLISLMQDQVSSLEASGIHSVFLNSTMGWEEYKATADEIKSGKIKIVYVSPEGLATGRIRELFSASAVPVSCITIDEAHCVSNWGHDFRPDYLEIKTARRLFPKAVMLALTATATGLVQKDIEKNLGLKNPAVFVASFNRSNIFLEVCPKQRGTEQIMEYISQHAGESGIIYCNSRRQTDELAKTLDDRGYSVLNYHAGLSDEVRARNQELFIKDNVQIMVATVAFGMGIDKPNVRFVINYDLPKSVEEYYQEIGRAGRDGLPSSALLLYSAGDIHKITYFIQDSADPQKAEVLLQGMVSYANSTVCRRKTLLAYFGEEFEPDKAARDCCCDICRDGEIPLTDMTVPAQKLLSCIIRTKERFGASYIIDILLGARSRRIIENGHQHLSTWGIGSELSRDEWFLLTEQLIAGNYLKKSSEFKVLELTSAGKAFIANRESVSFPMRITAKPHSAMYTRFPSAHKNDHIIAEKPPAGDKTAEKLVDELKKWRKRKADDLNVPPYIIFGDKTMLDLAAKKPRTKSELLNVYGIGEARAEQYGSSLLRIIEET